MDGKPLRYRRKDDGTFLMYSVGFDGKDDGGDGSAAEPDSPKPKEWLRMRDAVWLMPATREEVKKYEDEIREKLRIRPPGKLVPQIVPVPADVTKTN